LQTRNKLQMAAGAGFKPAPADFAPAIIILAPDIRLSPREEKATILPARRGRLNQILLSLIVNDCQIP
jgi:hypothetical protein